MNIYNDSGNKVVITRPITSASSVISNVTGIVIDYFKKKFPKNYFKYTYITTSQSSSLQVNANTIDNSEIYRKELPRLKVDPEITLDGQTADTTKNPLMSGTMQFVYKDIKRNYRPIFFDEENRIRLSYSSDYCNTIFNMEITVRTFLEHMDLLYYLRSNFQFGTYFRLPGTMIEIELPNDYIAMIAENYDLDLDNKSDVEKLDSILAKYADINKKIVRKRNLSKGNDCYYMQYPANLGLTVNLTDAPSQIARDGNTEGDYTTAMSIVLNYWMPNAFVLSAPIIKPELSDADIKFSDTINIPVELPRQESLLYHDDQTGETYVYKEFFWNGYIAEANAGIVSIPFGKDIDVNREKFFKYLLSSNYQITDEFNSLGEIVKPGILKSRLYSGTGGSLMDLLSKEEQQELQNYYQNNNQSESDKTIWIKSFFDSKVYTKLEVSPISYSFDWENMKVIINGGTPNQTYYLGLYVENEMLHRIEDAMKSKTKRKLDNEPLDILEFNGIADDEDNIKINVPIERIDSKPKNYSKNVIHAVRIETPYDKGILSAKLYSPEDALEIGQSALRININDNILTLGDLSNADENF